MEQAFYNQLAGQSIANETLARSTALEILTSEKVELLPLLNAAFEVRKKFVGKEVLIHIIDNVQNGFCPEDCHYCAQARSSDADIEEYPLKSDAEILAEAKNAYEKGAFRHCMVFAGRGPSATRVAHIARLIREIKTKYPPLQVCVSSGLLDEGNAKILKEAGLDRLNHNLNTSQHNYPNICTTHTYADRLNTLAAARRADLQLCSGVIVGMGETSNDILEVACTLRRLGVESIPVNFYIPIEGNMLGAALGLSPEYCLRVLCLFRLLNPRAEIRAAAGRELHLRSMQVMALYPANSLFLDGYLNTKGDDRRRTLQMIKDAGFTINSDHSVDELLGKEGSTFEVSPDAPAEQVPMKKLQDLRIFMSTPTT
ncbi:MAG: biotin synthase BioB [Candidatus Omnitrophica bacterium]|nr:biotin synthase BioB [Candidatus Omnitrophota bacterium]